MTRIQIPDAFHDLLTPARYKVYYGGRGSAKSWSFATILIALAASKPLRILCAREIQLSIA
ncbi:MAG: phage terminase large subunit, partial [Planctomycetota bacterium]